MRKQLKALLMTVALVTLSTGLIGCNNEKKQQQTTTQVETTENKVENKSYNLTLNILNTIRAKNSIKHITCTIGAIKFMNISNDG